MVTTTLTPTDDLVDEVVLDRIPMTYDEYRDWYDKETGRRGEWVDGEVIPFMSTSVRHGQLVRFLLHLIASYLETRPIGEVFPPEIELRVREGRAREPDLFVVLREHFGRIEKMLVRGAADVAIEIISPDSVTRDRGDKRREYAEVGIPEYWIIDPREGRESIEQLALVDGATYEPVAADDRGRLYSRVLPGLWLEAAWLVADDLPPAGRLGTEMAGVD